MSFRIRDALPTPTNTDAAFIISALDSCIPHLSTIGSATQWGSVPLSTARPDMINRHISAIADATNYRSTGSGPPIRVLVAEALSPASGEYVPVGSATLKGGYLPGYVREHKPLQEMTGRLLAGEEGEFMYLDILVTDFSEAKRELRRGAGAALVEFAREWAGRELGLGVMYVDCWAGNGEKLVSFYTAQGFEKVDGFVVEKPDGEKWPGMLLRMDLGKGNAE